MEYSKIIDGREVVFNGILVLENKQVLNPSHEQLMNAGWKEYIPPVVEPQPIEPSGDVVMEKIKSIVAEQFVKTMPDNEAILYKELFPTWTQLLGKEVKVGERLYYNDRLYKVNQVHTIQEQWKPGIETAALYTEIVDTTLEQTLGTADNPIAFALNMELKAGMYYVQDGIRYKCTRDLAASYWNLKELVAQYVEVS